MAKPKANARPTRSTKPKSEDEALKDEEIEQEEDEVEETESEEEVEETDSEDETDEEEAKSRTKLRARSQSKGPATIAQLREAFPKASSDFILQTLESRMTLDQAEMAYLKATVKSQADEIAALKSGQAAPGNKPLGNGGKSKGFEGDAVAAWNAAIKSKVDEGLPRSKAVSAVVRENPDLQSAYLAAMNAKKTR